MDGARSAARAKLRRAVAARDRELRGRGDSVPTASGHYRMGFRRGGNDGSRLPAANLRPRGKPVEINLKDRLSRLSYIEACKLLGTQADRLIREGAKWEIDIDQDVHLGEDLFRLNVAGRP